MGILWADWTAQPLEHRALYLQAVAYRSWMDAYDEQEREMKREAEARKSGGTRGRR